MMKRAFFLFALLLAAVTPAAAQNQTRERRVKDPSPLAEQDAARNRVVADQRDANHVRQPDVVDPSPVNSNKTSAPSWGDTAVANKETTREPASAISNTVRADGRSLNTGQPKLVKPTTLAVNDLGSVRETVAPASANNTGSVTSIYRVGIGDVLDIRLANLATRESTLFTVLKNGAIEYPLLETPLLVAGLTPDEIARRMNGEVKVIQNARASVSVRDYASHSVVITGAVDNPGQKILRREAMPLFAILAEALPRAEATTATILRNGKETSIAIGNNAQMSTLVMPGDAIKILAATRQFVYVGGAVVSGGEKEFRQGMTLTQALLASGGALREAGNKVKVVKRDRDGFLVPQEYDLQQINTGKAPDPLLQPGDRIELKLSM